MKNIFRSDDLIAGLARGAAKFGSSVAAKIVKEVRTRYNGFTPDEPEPYGEGVGGSETQQTGPLENTKYKCSKCGAVVEPADPDEVPTKCATPGCTGGMDFANSDSSALGFQSAEKSTTAHRDEELDNAGCQSGDHTWDPKGVCKACGKKWDEDLGKENSLNNSYGNHNISEDQKSGASDQDIAHNINAQYPDISLPEALLISRKIRREGPNAQVNWGSKRDENGELGNSKTPTIADVKLGDDGTLDTILYVAGCRHAFDQEEAAQYRDKNGVLRNDGFRKLAREALNDHLEQCVENAIENGHATATNKKCPTCDGPVVPTEGVSGSNHQYTCKRCAQDFDSTELKNSDDDRTMWGVRYRKGMNSTPGQKFFKTEAARSAWIEANSGDIEVDSYTSPEKTNAGHLSPHAWIAASTEERIQWLEQSGMDINEAVRGWHDLSLDVRVALGRAKDRPASANFENANDKVLCTCGHRSQDHCGDDENGRCSKCDCRSFFLENAKAQEPCPECGLPRQMRPEGAGDDSFVCGNRRCKSFKNSVCSCDAGDAEKNPNEHDGRCVIYKESFTRQNAVGGLEPDEAAWLLKYIKTTDRETLLRELRSFGLTPSQAADAYDEAARESGRKNAIGDGCDGSGPHSGTEIRKFPYGSSGGNILLCKACADRNEHGTGLKWNDAKVYSNAEYQPKTGEQCSCRPGVERDNCPMCEGTGQKIDFKKIRDQKPKQNADVVWWNVYLDGKSIDKVPYSADMSADDVKRSLVSHDGYDSNIVVKKERKNDADGDVDQIERHAEGILHEAEELERENAGPITQGARVKIRRDSGLGHKAGDTGVVTKVLEGGNLEVKFDNPDSWRSPTGGWDASDFDITNSKENADDDKQRCPACGHFFDWHMSRNGCDGTSQDGNVCGCKEQPPRKNAIDSHERQNEGVARGNAKYGARKNYDTDEMKDELHERIRVFGGAASGLDQSTAKRAAASIIRDAKGDLASYIKSNIGNEFDLQHYIENL